MEAVSILISPVVFFINPDEDVEKLFGFFNFLSDLKDFLSKNFSLSIIISKNTSQVLFDHGGYPQTELIREWIRNTGTNEVYNANDVFKLINFILDRAKFECDAFGCDAFLFDNLSLDPDFRNELEDINNIESELAVLVAIANGKNFNCIKSDNLIVTKTIDSSVTIKFNLEEIEPLTSLTNQDIIGIEIEENLTVISLYTPLLKKVVGENIWQFAEKEIDLQLGIFAKCFELSEINRIEFDREKLSKITVGNNFLSSLQPYAGLKNLVLRKCCQVALELPVADERPFRTALGNRAPQKQRADGALAFRVHLTTSHEGMRLMYWRKNEQIEFANIGPKNELYICE